MRRISRPFLARHIKKLKRAQHGHRVVVYVETRCSHPVDLEYLLRGRISRGPVFLAEKSQESLLFQQAHRQIDGERLFNPTQDEKVAQPRYTLLCSFDLLCQNAPFQFVLLRPENVLRFQSLTSPRINFMVDSPATLCTTPTAVFVKDGFRIVYVVPACVV